ncbi:MAG: histidine ammonia-lyase [Bacteroidota bacterium]|nr:histidine ammonia-lyase [Bacteroidota bacterium]
MIQTITLSDKHWRLGELGEILQSGAKIEISSSIRESIHAKRKILEERIQSSDEALYGINTGFGALCNTTINDNELDQLQINLVRSHACGTGVNINPEIVRIVLLLKMKSLSFGFSGIRMEVLNFLALLYNLEIYPCIPEFGSLGASGDLAPLAHLSLSFLAEGKVFYKNQIYPTAELFEELHIQAPGLKAKEGLALLNGTQYSTALLIYNLFLANNLIAQSSAITALSLEAFNGNVVAFHPEIHSIRNQLGQQFCAEQVLHYLQGSDIHHREKSSVQDPYSFRCVPQVHGASLDAIDYVSIIAEREMNAVTDNPLILTDGSVVSGGNFHAQPIALAADFLAIALAELASISERRIYQLIIGQRGLPDFLTEDPGLHSGYMILQYSAASLVSMNKQLATPASVDSIISSKAQEDHVSMSANAGLKCKQIAQHTTNVLAMEWMTASRAMNWRKDWKMNAQLQKIVDEYRQLIPFESADHVLADQIPITAQFLKNKF